MLGATTRYKERVDATADADSACVKQQPISVSLCTVTGLSNVVIEIPYSTSTTRIRISHKPHAVGAAPRAFASSCRCCVCSIRNKRLNQQAQGMGGPALLPIAVAPPRHKQTFPWQTAVLPVPKPARNIRRRSGAHPFADMAAGFGDFISSISQGIPQCHCLALRSLSILQTL